MTGIDKNRELALMVIWQGADFLVQDRTHSDEDGIGFFGGRVKEEEEPLEAALREVAEEISPKIEKRIRHQIENRIKRPGTDYDFEPITDRGWLINFFQASLPQDEVIKSKEGEALKMLPMHLLNHDRLMSATRAILKEIVLIPNGLIDN